MQFKKNVRKILDCLYSAGGIGAGLAVVSIYIVVVLQVITRWASVPFPGATQYSGYLMTASTFLALAYALNSGAHVRVTLALNALGKYRRLGELWCYFVGAILMAFFTYSSAHSVLWSKQFNDVSLGLDATPLWIPQLAMTTGAGLFALALADKFVQLIFSSEHNVNTTIVRSSPQQVSEKG